MDTSDWHVSNERITLTFTNLKFEQPPGGSSYELTDGTAAITGSANDSWTYWDGSGFHTCNFKTTYTKDAGKVSGSMFFDSATTPRTAYINNLAVPTVITYSGFSGDCVQYNKPTPTTVHGSRAAGGSQVSGRYDKTAQTITLNQASNNGSGTWTTTGKLTGMEYKIAFYSSGIHAFVQFHYPNGLVLTYGKFATSNWPLSDIKTQLAALVYLPGTRLNNGGSTWDWKIVYPVSQQQFKAGLLYATDPANYQTYNLLVANCVAYIQGVANAAGLQLPDFTDYNAPVLQGLNQYNNLHIADGNGMTVGLQDIGDGGTFAGGTVMRSQGGTADSSPDPVFPQDPGSPGPLARVALANPGGTARTYRFQLVSQHLSATGTGANVSLRDTPSGDAAATITAIDWGDGSPPRYAVQADPARDGTVTVAHSYSRPGTYTDKVVVVEDGKLVLLTGTVVVGSSGTGVQSFTVPKPGPQVEYRGLGAPAVRVRAATTRIHRGSNATIRVTVSPPSPHNAVRLQRYTGGHWRDIKTERLSGASTVTFSLFPKSTTIYRAAVAAAAPHDLEYSDPITIAVI